MKKIIIGITAIIAIFSLVGCEKSTNSNIDKSYGNSNEERKNINETAEDKRVYITDDLYELWINQIYMDPKEYEGATIRLEGMYTNYYSKAENKNMNMVYRVVSGGAMLDGHTHDDDDEHILQDDMYGFVFDYDGDMPKDNDWIEVEGILEIYESNGEKYLKLKASSVAVKSNLY